MRNFVVIFLFVLCFILSLIYLNSDHQKNISEHGMKINESFVSSSSSLLENNTNSRTHEQRLFDTSTPSPAAVQTIIDYYEKVIVEMRDYLLHSKVTLKSKLFPWLVGIGNAWNESSYVGQKQSKGIVICSGNRHVRWTMVALKCLEMIGNDLPIEVMYFTSKDLSVENQELMRKSFPNVYLTDVSLKYVNESYLDLHSRQMKPFAVLASRFEQVVLMDSDVLFLNKPSILFSNVFFVQSGSLFFYGRSEVSNETKKWIQSFSTKQQNQSMIPERRQDSGVVVIDKSRVLKGVLSTCKLNDHQGQKQRDTYKYLYDDRDTWWLGFSMVGISSTFMPTLTGVIGKTDDGNKERVFGNILHFDEYYEPIWWNGGMFRNRDVNDELMEVNGWLEEGQWSFGRYSSIFYRGKRAHELNETQKELINSYRKITKQVFNV